MDQPRSSAGAGSKRADSGISGRSDRPGATYDDGSRIGGEQLVEVVSDVLVVQGQGVAVLAQGGAGFGVAQPLLRLEKVAVGDQGGGA